MTTDHGDWLVQVTELTDIDKVFWVLSLIRLFNVEECLVFTVGAAGLRNFLLH